jgi:hypothetical protein
MRKEPGMKAAIGLGEAYVTQVGILAGQLKMHTPLLTLGCGQADCSIFNGHEETCARLSAASSALHPRINREISH